MSPIWKHLVKAPVSVRGGALYSIWKHNGSVSEAAEPDWFLREWMTHFGKKQADLVKDLNWQRARASKVFHGAIPYRKETVAEVSAWLGLEPYELFLPPQRALALRAIQASAETIVASADRFLPPESPIAPARDRKTGTTGR